MAALLALLAGYLSGSVPIGLMIGRVHGVDLRARGSGRIGATNALRTLGPRTALWVFLGDILKAAAPVVLFRLLFPNEPAAEVAAALGAVVGHNWPIFIGFRGGRGVSTGLGTVLVMSLPAAAIGLAIFGIILVATRYVSLGSILGVSGAGALLVLLAVTGAAPAAYGVYGVLCAALIVVQHRDNIQRLLAGNERRIGKAE